MTNVNKKFKDRNPEETVKIIENFFNKKGYKVEIVQKCESEAGTFSFGLSLYKNRVKILHSSGKGMSEAYALASGYAELYERFCNKCNFTRHPFFIQHFNKAMYEKHGYYFHPDEVILTYEDIMQYNMYNSFYTKLLHSQKNIETFWKLINNNDQIIGEPYYDLTNNKTVYHNLAIANRITTSGGLAAGNSLEEALNQGLSELCEHMTVDKFMLEEQDIYYVIDPSILSPHLQSAINNIEKAGFKFFIFDLSYNFNMPVAMSLLINPFTQHTQINLGAFPIFDIAVERVITEMYQNVKHFAIGNNIDISPQVPYLINSDNELNHRHNSLGEVKTFNEEILLNKIKIVQSCNTKIFKTDKELSNKEILNYLVDLFKTQGYSIHYIDRSLCDEIKAVSILIPEYDYSPGQFLDCLYHSEEKIYYNLIFIMRLHKLANSIINNQDSIDINFKRFLMLQNSEMEINQQFHDGEMTGALIFLDWINPVPATEGISWLNLFLDNLYDSGALYNTIYYPVIKKFLTLQIYTNTKKYSKDKIKQIMKLFFDINTTDEDIDKCFDMTYLFDKIIVETTYNYYHSNDYKEIIESVIP